MKYFFYPGCAYKTSAGYKESTDAVCRKLGVALEEVPDWNCCGATIMLGEEETVAAALAGRLFAKAAKAGYSEIVTGCNACYTTLRKGSKLLSGNPTIHEKVSRGLQEEGLTLGVPAKVRHLADVLVHDIPKESWQPQRQETLSALNVAVYYGCQYSRPWDMTPLGNRPQVLDDFLSMLGFSTVEHAAKTLCCGASAAVPLEKECTPLVSRIVRGAQSKNADLMATLCPLCQFNMDSLQKKAEGPPLPVLFFTQLAGIALGIDEKDLGLDKLIHPADKALKKLVP